VGGGEESRAVVNGGAGDGWGGEAYATCWVKYVLNQVVVGAVRERGHRKRRFGL